MATSIMEEQEETIWMDGRPHPPENAVHTWSGFSTGEWDGDTLVVTTTHLKESYERRDGLMRSDRATVRTRWRRLGQLFASHVHSLRSGLYDRTLHPKQHDVGRRSDDADAPVPMRRGELIAPSRGARFRTSFPERVLARAEQGFDRSVRNAL